MLVTGYYLILFILSIIVILRYMICNQKVDSRCAMVGLMVVINCFGRYLLSISHTIEMAEFANMFLYVGSLYSQIFTLLIVEKFCDLKVSKIVKGAMLLYASIIMILVLTTKYTGLYYKSVSLVRANGYSYIKKVYGPCHMLNPIWTFLLGIILVGILLYSYRNKDNISYKMVRVSSSLVLLIFILYLADKILDTNISLVAAGYLIALTAMSSIFERISIYDLQSNIVKSIEGLKEYGYLLFDEKNRYVGANEYIKELFPEIKKWKIDTVINKYEGYVYDEILTYLYENNSDENNSDEMESKTIEVNDKYFEVHCREIIYKGKKAKGHIIELADRTVENKYINAMKDYSIMLEDEVAEKTEDIMYVKDMLVLGLADLLENRDSSTGGHIKRTSEVVRIFSKELIKYSDELGVTQLFLERVAKAAPMHDIGKIAIDDKVLRKKGRYTDEEFEKMKKHTVEGAKIIEQIMKNVEDDRIYNIIRNVACYHHEKWNGKGYPEGLKEEEIPLEARIMALADVFDALVSKRCYKDAFSYDDAFNIIEESLGEHFDPKLGKIFLECRKELEELYSKA